MYKAEKKFSVDTVFGAVLVVGGIVWTSVTLLLAPVPDVDAAKLVAQKSEQPRMVLAEPASSSSGGEVTTFPTKDMEVIVDKKYA